MLLLPQRSVPSSGGQMALQPLDQVHWPTEPDWLPEPALSRVRAWILGKAQPVAFVGGSLCVPDLSGKLSRASFKVACALQPCTVEKKRWVLDQLLQPGSGWDQVAARPLPSPVLCWEMRVTLGNIIKRFPIKFSVL